MAIFEGSFTGHAGLRRFFDNVMASMDSFEVDYDDVRDLGDRLVALGTVRGRGKESGAEIVDPLAVVATFRNGKVVHFKDHGDRGEALKAAGVEK